MSSSLTTAMEEEEEEEEHEHDTPILSTTEQELSFAEDILEKLYDVNDVLESRKVCERKKETGRITRSSRRTPSVSQKNVL